MAGGGSPHLHGLQSSPLYRHGALSTLQINLDMINNIIWQPSGHRHTILTSKCIVSPVIQIWLGGASGVFDFPTRHPFPERQTTAMDGDPLLGI
jgi:hypothetical protein